MLKIAFDLDALEAGERMSRRAAVETMRARRGCYDAELVEALLGPAETAAPPPPLREQAMEVELRRLQAGMKLAEEVRTSGGRVLIARNEMATAESIQRVKRALDFNELRQIVRVVKSRGEAAAPIPAAPPTPNSVDCGGMTLDLTLRLTV